MQTKLFTLLSCAVLLTSTVRSEDVALTPNDLRAFDRESLQVNGNQVTAGFKEPAAEYFEARKQAARNGAIMGAAGTIGALALPATLIYEAGSKLPLPFQLAIAATLVPAAALATTAYNSVQDYRTLSNASASIEANPRRVIGTLETAEYRARQAALKNVLAAHQKMWDRGLQPVKQAAPVANKSVAAKK